MDPQNDKAFRGYMYESSDCELGVPGVQTCPGLLNHDLGDGNRDCVFVSSVHDLNRYSLVQRTLRPLEHEPWRAR